MAQKKTRYDFTEKTKIKIAQRAAYRCSMPNCNKLTVGPGNQTDEISLTGQAAHIYAASKNGPRGQGDLKKEEIESVANGIWTCATHASLIDKNSGVRYPVNLLKSWKALHEFQIEREHSDTTNTIGFIRTLSIKSSPLFEQNTEISLGKTTLIVGKNHSGKTAICQWLYSVQNLKYMWRWYKSQALNFEIEFDCPSRHILNIKAQSGNIEVKLNKSPRVGNPFQYKVIFIKNRGKRREGQTPLELLCEILQIDEFTFRSLINRLDDKSLFLKKIEILEEEDENLEKVQTLYCTKKSTHTEDRRYSFGAFSGGEQARIILDLAICLAQDIVEHSPALLIIEWSSMGIDDAGLASYFEFLSSSNCNFQTFITTNGRSELSRSFGWQVYDITQTEELNSITNN